MPQKRLRIFAGPNGSGKSSLLEIIPGSVPLGYYINADEIEKQIASGLDIPLSTYGISSNSDVFYSFLENSDFVKIKSDMESLSNMFTIRNNVIKTKTSNLPPKYSAAIISDFIREENLNKGNDFSFEAEMSHSKKIDFIRRANSNGYHVYLYYISTDDVRVNVERVKTRVRNGGHQVPENKIKERYLRSLDLLYDALKICYKSYLFDNSDKTIEIARIDRDRKMYILVPRPLIPNWIIKYVIFRSV